MNNIQLPDVVDIYEFSPDSFAFIVPMGLWLSVSV